MNVKIHPLAERLSRKLFGITSMEEKEINHMVARGIRSATEFYDRTLIEATASRDIIIKKQHDVIESALVILVEDRGFMETRDLLDLIEKELLKGLK